MSNPTFNGKILDLNGRKVYYVHSAPSQAAKGVPVVAIHGLGG